ncbi:MAG: hypothetical protein ABEH81_12230 [Halopenitus sp.]
MSEPPDRVYGIDFSAAARDAGRNVWIAAGVPGAEGDRLAVDTLEPAVDFFEGDPTAREETLERLRCFIAGEEDAAFGLDFPFGVASDVTDATEWTEFVARFPETLDVDLSAGAGEEAARPAKRFYDAMDAAYEDATAVAARDVDAVGLSPVDWRMKELTFYGIRDVLRPLVTGKGVETDGVEAETDGVEAETDGVDAERDKSIAGDVAVVPMQPVADRSVVVFETYPSEVFRELDANPDGYKGRRNGHLQARLENLHALEGAGVAFAGDGERANGEGPASDDARARRVKASAYDDALDALGACYATWKHTATGADFEHAPESFGEIYV